MGPGGFDGGMTTVVIPLFEGFQPLDAIGPHEVFAGANQAMDHLDRPGPRYTVHLAADAPGPVVSESGLRLEAAIALDAAVPRHDTLPRHDTPPRHDTLPRHDTPPRHSPTETGGLGTIDTVVVPGGQGTRLMGTDHPVVCWLAATAPRVRRMAGVCTGTFALAQAGLCVGRRVTTHWAHAGELARRHPELDVDPDPIYLADGGLWTSAGVTAGIDLALALVEDDCGPTVAQIVARHLVVYLRRPGGQSQFSAPVWSEPTALEPVRRACDLIHHAPHDDLTIDRLAAAVGLSPRHFARLFRAEIGEPPARYVERVRGRSGPHHPGGTRRSGSTRWPDAAASPAPRCSAEPSTVVSGSPPPPTAANRPWCERPPPPGTRPPTRRSLVALTNPTTQPWSPP